MHAIELWVWLALSFWEFPPIQHNSVIHLGQPLQARLSPPSAVAFPLQSRSFPKTSFWRHKVWTFFSFLFSYLLLLSQCKQTTNINFQTLYCCLSDWEPGLSDKQILKTCLTTLLDDCKGWLVLCVLGKSSPCCVSPSLYPNCACILTRGIVNSALNTSLRAPSQDVSIWRLIFGEML